MTPVTKSGMPEHIPTGRDGDVSQVSSAGKARNAMRQTIRRGPKTWSPRNLSGSGGARILVCGFSGHRYTISATDPCATARVTPLPSMKKARCQADTGLGRWSPPTVMVSAGRKRNRIQKRSTTRLSGQVGTAFPQRALGQSVWFEEEHGRNWRLSPKIAVSGNAHPKGSQALGRRVIWFPRWCLNCG
jgi:hypothetical protein